MKMTIEIDPKELIKEMEEMIDENLKTNLQTPSEPESSRNYRCVQPIKSEPDSPFPKAFYFFIKENGTNVFLCEASRGSVVDMVHYLEEDYPQYKGKLYVLIDGVEFKMINLTTIKNPKLRRKQSRNALN
jgi:hypothetical protein